MENNDRTEIDLGEVMKIELSLLLKYGNIGFYSHCKVEQIVLINKENQKTYNFFTHINFEKNYASSSSFEYLTPCCYSINPKYQMAISSYTIDVDKF